MSESSRTTLVGILVVAGRRLSAAELIRLAAPLGLSATNVKSHLTRMVAEGVLERDGPARLARYGPSPAQLQVIEGIQARLKTSRQEPWDRTWMMLALPPPAQRGERERRRAVLWFDGWRPVRPDVYVRPAWPRACARGAAGFCIRGVFLPAPIDAAALYDLAGLDSEARRLAGWLKRRSLRARSPRAAFVERIKVGGRVAQFIGHDPRLPPAIWGRRHGMQEVIKAYRRFEARIAPQSREFIRAGRNA